MQTANEQSEVPKEINEKDTNSISTNQSSQNPSNNINVDTSSKDKPQEIINNNNNSEQNKKEENNINQSNTKKEDNKEVVQPTNEIDEDYIIFPDNEVCHRILPKGCNIDIDHYYYYKCFKLKERGNFLSAIGIKAAKIQKVDYLIFFDEIYLYLAKDIVIDKTKPNIRRLGNKYCLFSFINATFNKKEDSNIYKLVLEITHETNPELLIEKEYYFTEEFAGDFFEELQEHLLRLGIMQRNEDNGEEGEGEEWEDIEGGEEEGEEGEEPKGENIEDKNQAQEDVKDEEIQKEENIEEHKDKKKKKKKLKNKGKNAKENNHELKIKDENILIASNTEKKPQIKNEENPNKVIVNEENPNKIIVNEEKKEEPKKESNIELNNEDKKEDKKEDNKQESTKVKNDKDEDEDEENDEDFIKEMEQNM